MKVNAAPLFHPFPESIEATTSRAIDPAVLEERAAYIDSNGELRDRLVRIFLSAKDEKQISEHVEDRIYSGFTNDSDLSILDEFHATPWEERQAVLNRLEDKRLQELGLRLIFLERPDVLNEATRRQMQDWQTRRLYAKGDVPWLTIPSALAEIEGLLATVEGLDYVHLAEHRALLQRRSIAGHT